MIKEMHAMSQTITDTKTIKIQFDNVDGRLLCEWTSNSMVVDVYAVCLMYM